MRDFKTESGVFPMNERNDFDFCLNGEVVAQRLTNKLSIESTQWQPNLSLGINYQNYITYGRYDLIIEEIRNKIQEDPNITNITRFTTALLDEIFNISVSLQANGSDYTIKIPVNT